MLLRSSSHACASVLQRPHTTVVKHRSVRACMSVQAATPSLSRASLAWASTGSGNTSSINGVGGGGGGGESGGGGGGANGGGGSAGSGGSGSAGDDFLSNLHAAAGLSLTATALKNPEAFQNSVEPEINVKARLLQEEQDWIRQHPDGAMVVMFDTSGLVFSKQSAGVSSDCDSVADHIARAVGGLEHTIAVAIGEDLRTPYKLLARMATPEGTGQRRYNELLYGALDSDDPAKAMADILHGDHRRRMMQQIAARAASKPCMTGFVPNTPTVPYFTGCGYQSDDLLGGAMAHAEAMARRHLGVKGPLLFVTAAADDDWLVMGAMLGIKKHVRLLWSNNVFIDVPNFLIQLGTLAGLQPPYTLTPLALLLAASLYAGDFITTKLHPGPYGTKLFTMLQTYGEDIVRLASTPRFTLEQLWSCPPFAKALSDIGGHQTDIKRAVLSFLLPALDPTWLAAALEGSEAQVLVRGSHGTPVAWADVLSGREQLFWQPSAACILQIQQLGLLRVYNSTTTTIRGPLNPTSEQVPEGQQQPSQGLDKLQLSEVLVGLLHVIPTLGGVFSAVTPVMSGCGGVQSDWHDQHGTLQHIASDTDLDNITKFRDARLAALARPVFNKQQQYVYCLYEVGTAMQAANNTCCSSLLAVWTAARLPFAIGFQGSLSRFGGTGFMESVLLAGRQLGMYMKVVRSKAPSVGGYSSYEQLVCAASQQQLDELVLRLPAETAQQLSARQANNAALKAELLLEMLADAPRRVMSLSLAAAFNPVAFNNGVDLLADSAFRKAMADLGIVVFLGPNKQKRGSRDIWQSSYELVGHVDDIDPYFEEVSAEMLSEYGQGLELFRLLTEMRQQLQEEQQSGGAGAAVYTELRNAAAESMGTTWAALQAEHMPPSRWDGARGCSGMLQGELIMRLAQRATNVPQLERLFSTWVPGKGLPNAEEQQPGQVASASQQANLELDESNSQPMLLLYSCTAPTPTTNSNRPSAKCTFAALDSAAAAAHKEVLKLAVEQRREQWDATTGGRSKVKREQKQLHMQGFAAAVALRAPLAAVENLPGSDTDEDKPARKLRSRAKRR